MFFKCKNKCMIIDYALICNYNNYIQNKISQYIEFCQLEENLFNMI